MRNIVLVAVAALGLSAAIAPMASAASADQQGGFAQGGPYAENQQRARQPGHPRQLIRVCCHCTGVDSHPKGWPVPAASKLPEDRQTAGLLTGSASAPSGRACDPLGLGD